MKLQTTIKGYTIDLHTDEGDDSGCWITKRHAGTEYTASLDSAIATGDLENSREGVIAIREADTDAIEAWAIANCY